MQLQTGLCLDGQAMQCQAIVRVKIIRFLPGSLMRRCHPVLFVVLRSASGTESIIAGSVGESSVQVALHIELPFHDNLSFIRLKNQVWACIMELEQLLILLILLAMVRIKSHPHINLEIVTKERLKIIESILPSVVVKKSDSAIHACLILTLHLISGILRRFDIGSNLPHKRTKLREE